MRLRRPVDGVLATVVRAGTPACRWLHWWMWHWGGDAGDTAGVGAGAGARALVWKTWGGRAALRVCVMASSCNIDRTSAKDERGRIMGMKATCLSNCSPSPTSSALMRVRSSTRSPSSRSSSPMALIRWQKTETVESPCAMVRSSVCSVLMRASLLS